MRTWFLALVAILIAGPALAQDIDCENAMTQADMNQCAGLDFESADKALNEAWTEVHDEVKARDADADADGKGWPDALLKSQRAWLAFRDAECESQGFAYRGGSMEPMVVATCKAELTTARTQQLQSLIEEQ